MRDSLRSDRRPERGFSLLELLVSLVIIIVISIAALSMFDRSNRMAKVETSVSDAQQNARYASYQVVREARMAGAGGLPASTGSVQQGVTLSLGTSSYHSLTPGKHLLNNINVGSNDLVCVGGTCGSSGAHHIRSGTDALHIRGIIANALYDLGTSSFDVSTGTLVIHACAKFPDPTSTNDSSHPCYPNGQNDVSFFSSWSDTQPRMFVMSDALGNIGVSLITHAVVGSDGTNEPNATLTLSTTNAYANSLNSSGAFSAGLTTPTRGGVLDDLLYFIDDGTDLGKTCGAANQSALPGPCHPQLVVAQWGAPAGGCSTTVETPMACATVTPIADDIEDLQIAYGLDFRSMTCTGGASLTCTGTGTFASPVSDGSLSVLDASSFANIVKGAYTTTAPNADPSEDTSAADKDEWIGNVSGEITTSGSFGYTSDLSLLKSVVIAVLAKGTQPDPAYVGLGAKSWSVMDTGAQTISAQNSLAYHRRLISVRTNLRNFGTF